MVQEWKILCTFLLVLVSTWTAVFARVILQNLCYRISLSALSFWVISDYSCVENTNMKIKKSKLRLWAKHAAEQIQYHIQLGNVFELSIKRSGSQAPPLLILEQNINRNQEKMVRMFSSELKNGKRGYQRFSKVQLQSLFSVLLVL